MKQERPLYRVIACGHAFRIGHPAARLELLGLVPCRQCVDECEDRMLWLDERADEQEARLAS